jgi:sirohydrochlorin ferrochelatase
MNRMACLAAAAMLIVFSAGLPPACAAAAGAHGKPFGLLLLGEGGSKDWDKIEKSILERSSGRYLLEFSPGRADIKSIQKSIDRLQSRKVGKIVALPLFLGGESEVMDQLRFIFGIRKEPSAEFFGGAQKAGSSIIRRAQSRVPLVLARAIDDQPAVAEALAFRALALSKGPQKESVVLVSPAPGSEEAGRQWERTLHGLAERVRANGNFQSASSFLLEEDAVQSRRDRRRKLLQDGVRRLSRSATVLVVPVAVTADGFVKHIPRVLRGTFMKFEGKALLPDEKLADWAAESALAAAKLPDMRMFKDAGRKFTPRSPQGAFQ